MFRMDAILLYYIMMGTYTSDRVYICCCSATPNVIIHIGTLKINLDARMSTRDSPSFRIIYTYILRYTDAHSKSISQLSKSCMRGWLLVHLFRGVERWAMLLDNMWEGKKKKKTRTVLHTKRLLILKLKIYRRLNRHRSESFLLSIFDTIFSRHTCTIIFTEIFKLVRQCKPKK